MKGLQLIGGLLVLLALLTGATQGRTVDLTVENFESELYGNPAEESEWIIEFYTPWCSVCRQFTPVFTLVATQYQHAGSPLKFGKVNADEQLALSARFMIASIPTVYYVKISPTEGELVYEVKPAMTEQDWSKTLASQSWKNTQPWDAILSPFSFSGKLLYVVAKWVAIGWNKTMEWEQEYGIPPWVVLLAAFTLSLLFPLGLAYFMGEKDPQPAAPSAAPSGASASAKPQSSSPKEDKEGKKEKKKDK